MLLAHKLLGGQSTGGGKGAPKKKGGRLSKRAEARAKIFSQYHGRGSGVGKSGGGGNDENDDDDDMLRSSVWEDDTASYDSEEERIANGTIVREVINGVEVTRVSTAPAISSSSKQATKKRKKGTSESVSSAAKAHSQSKTDPAAASGTKSVIRRKLPGGQVVDVSGGVSPREVPTVTPVQTKTASSSKGVIGRKLARGGSTIRKIVKDGKITEVAVDIDADDIEEDTSEDQYTMETSDEEEEDDYYENDVMSEQEDDGIDHEEEEEEESDDAGGDASGGTSSLQQQQTPSVKLANRWLDSYAKVSKWMQKYDIQAMLKAGDGICRVKNFLPADVAEGCREMLSGIPEDDWVVTQTTSSGEFGGEPVAHTFMSLKTHPQIEALSRAISILLPGELHTFSAARYDKQHHIAPHDDRAFPQVVMDDGEIVTCSRWIAVIVYFAKGFTSYEDGGSLVDLEAKKQSNKMFVPEFNSMVAFEVPRWHEVTPVAVANRPRYSMFGWFLQPGKQYDIDPSAVAPESVVVGNKSGKTNVKGGNVSKQRKVEMERKPGREMKKKISQKSDPSDTSFSTVRDGINIDIGNDAGVEPKKKTKKKKILKPRQKYVGIGIGIGDSMAAPEMGMRGGADRGIGGLPGMGSGQHMLMGPGFRGGASRGGGATNISDLEAAEKRKSKHGRGGGGGSGGGGGGGAGHKKKKRKRSSQPAGAVPSLYKFPQ